MIKVKRIDHVAVAVAHRDAAAERLAELFGLVPGAREHVAGQGADVTFLHVDGHGNVRVDADAAAGSPGGAAAAVEICAPAGNPSLKRFLESRGPGLHHVCFEVDDLPAALADLKAAGVRLIDEVPRLGARGHLVAFLHPSATGGVLFELCAPAGAGASPEVAP
jgi:methylmalonyl-CoA/ethylmalonyl-CoA epimerase